MSAHTSCIYLIPAKVIHKRTRMSIIQLPWTGIILTNTQLQEGSGMKQPRARSQGLSSFGPEARDRKRGDPGNEGDELDTGL